jgi:hypothetical protein
MGIIARFANAWDSLNNLGVGNTSDPAYYFYQLDCINNETARLGRYQILDATCSSVNLCPPPQIPKANVQLFTDCKDEYLNQCPHTAPYPPRNCTYDPQSLPVICGGNATTKSWKARCATAKHISLPCLDLNHYPPMCPYPKNNHAVVIASVTIAMVVALLALAVAVWRCCKQRNPLTWRLSNSTNVTAQRLQ